MATMDRAQLRAAPLPSLDIRPSLVTERAVEAVRGNCLFLMPSLYGGVSWVFWLVMYSARLILWDRPSKLSMPVFVLVAASYLTGTVIFYPFYRSWYRRNAARERSVHLKNHSVDGSIVNVVILFNIVGFIGVVQYLLVSAREFGGFSNFFSTLVYNSYLIRQNSSSVESLGVQLSYFGWLAVGLTVYFLSKSMIPKWMLPIAAAQLLLNLTFIDRTRPLWIIFTSVLMVVPGNLDKFSAKILKNAAIGAVIFAVTFVAFANWTGKIVYNDRYEPTPLPASLQLIYVYGTGGFAFYDDLLNQSVTPDYLPERIMYPLFKMLSLTGVAPVPPPQVLDVRYVPFATNVGTFIEPFYNDGGMVYAIFGIIIYTFGFNLIGLVLLKSGGALSLFFWSNLCFAALIGSFTPKIGSTAIWLFGFAALAGAVIRRRSEKVEQAQ